MVELVSVALNYDMDLRYPYLFPAPTDFMNINSHFVLNQCQLFQQCIKTMSYE